MKYLLVCAPLLLLGGCAKFKENLRPRQTTPQLPAETQTGANTFGCLLNGKVWLPVGRVFSGGSLQARHYGSYLSINASRSIVENGVTTDQSIHFTLGDMGLVERPGLYILDDSTNRYVRFSDLEDYCDYESGQVPGGQIYLTRLDYTRRIISGRFTFTLRRPGCPNVEAADGRFDLQF